VSLWRKHATARGGMLSRMNKAHLIYCASPEWGEVVRDRIIPWASGGIDLGEDLLEIGPGPGLTTDQLRLLVPRLTAVEVDSDLATQLRTRLDGTNVTVVEADATRLPLETGAFSSAICLTMLHHVPTAELQDELFAEMRRAVRPGGVVIGSDSLDSPEFRSFHEDDICNPVDPGTIVARLERAGLRDVQLATNPFSLRFIARVP